MSVCSTTQIQIICIVHLYTPVLHADTNTDYMYSAPLHPCTAHWHKVITISLKKNVVILSSTLSCLISSINSLSSWFLNVPTVPFQFFCHLTVHVHVVYCTNQLKTHRSSQLLQLNLMKHTTNRICWSINKRVHDSPKNF